MEIWPKAGAPWLNRKRKIRMTTMIDMLALTRRSLSIIVSLRLRVRFFRFSFSVSISPLAQISIKREEMEGDGVYPHLATLM
jgi:hypothetical protein